jgi:hypothetical protein
MKTMLLTFWGFLATVLLPFQDPDLKELRRLLNEGNNSKESAAELYQKIGEYGGEDPLMLGYKASAWALQARYSGNPLKKLKSIKTSSRIFTDAVNQDGNNLELRFLRYAVEVNTPKSLHLSNHVNEDKTILIEALRKYPDSNFSPETAQIALDFLQDYCSCSEEEKQVLNTAKI